MADLIAPTGVRTAAERFAAACLDAFDSHNWALFGLPQPQWVCRRCLLPLDAIGGARCTARWVPMDD